MKRVFAAVVLTLILSGCSLPWIKGAPGAVERWPILPEIKRPTIELPEDVKVGESAKLDAMIDAVFDAMEWGKTMEAIIEVHNKNAKAHNQQVRRNLGLLTNDKTKDFDIR